MMPLKHQDGDKKPLITQSDIFHSLPKYSVFYVRETNVAPKQQYGSQTVLGWDLMTLMFFISKAGDFSDSHELNSHVLVDKGKEEEGRRKERGAGWGRDRGEEFIRPAL